MKKNHESNIKVSIICNWIFNTYMGNFQATKVGAFPSQKKLLIPTAKYLTFHNEFSRNVFT